MSPIEQLEFYTGLDKVGFAVKLLKDNEELALSMHPDGYHVSISGGKDSDGLVKVVRLAEVKHTLHYYESPIDPPEVRKHIKECYPETIWENYAKGFWKLVRKKGLPMRNRRWCCEHIKEAGGFGRLVVTGVRASESRSRSSYHYLRPYIKSKKETKLLLSPLLSFTSYDIWQFLKENGIKYCSLYDEGASGPYKGDGYFQRIGCVLCPFSRNIAKEEEYFPKIVNLWKLACQHSVEDDIARGYLSKKGKPLKNKFKTGDEKYQWWIRR